MLNNAQWKLPWLRKHSALAQLCPLQQLESCTAPVSGNQQHFMMQPLLAELDGLWERSELEFAAAITCSATSRHPWCAMAEA